MRHDQVEKTTTGCKGPRTAATLQPSRAATTSRRQDAIAQEVHGNKQKEARLVGESCCLELFVWSRVRSAQHVAAWRLCLAQGVQKVCCSIHRLPHAFSEKVAFVHLVQRRGCVRCRPSVVASLRISPASAKETSDPQSTSGACGGLVRAAIQVLRPRLARRKEEQESK